MTFVFQGMFRRNLPRLVVKSLLLGVITAGCSDGTAVVGHPTEAHVRVVNALFQGSDTATATPIAIDYLIDSAVVKPSLFGMPSLSLSTSDSANGYEAMPSGVHTFVARRASDTSMNASVYTTSTNLPYLPHWALTGNYYTIVVAGIIPPTGKIPNGAVPITVLLEDQFAGARLNNVLQARFKVLNAAPYADLPNGDYGSVNVYVTPGSTIPADPTIYALTTWAGYRSTSQYINLDPGTYVISLVSSGGAIVAQQAVTFNAGEVRTLILLSTAAGQPNVANHQILNVLDHQY